MVLAGMEIQGGPNQNAMQVTPFGEDQPEQQQQFMLPGEGGAVDEQIARNVSVEDSEELLLRFDFRQECSSWE